jgi:hypothetical protein
MATVSLQGGAQLPTLLVRTACGLGIGCVALALALASSQQPLAVFGAALLAPVCGWVLWTGLRGQTEGLLWLMLACMAFDSKAPPSWFGMTFFGITRPINVIGKCML